MQFEVITLFPEFIEGASSYGVVGRAIKEKKVYLKTWDLKEFSNNSTKRVDDRPYGGGPGMVLLAEPVIKAIDTIKKKIPTSYVVYLSPKGTLFNQNKAKELLSKKKIVLISGRYEGIDQRVLDSKVDDEISVGDFVLTGGEIPALIMIDAIARLIPGVLGAKDSLLEDSFTNGLLEYPHYTRPEKGYFGDVPGVLLSGDHAAIAKWRLKQSLIKTMKRRPDLMESKKFSEEEKKLISEIISEEKA